MSKKSIKPISLAVGAAFAAGLTAGNVSAETNQNTNPFSMNELSGGYTQLAYGGGDAAGDKSGKEGKCGEGKCGNDKKTKKAKKEGKCGEGKCGEGKCGNKKGKSGEGMRGGEEKK